MNQLVVDLTAARDLIANPRNWGKGALWQARKGTDTGWCFCLNGALSIAAGGQTITPDGIEPAWDAETNVRFINARSEVQQTLSERGLTWKVHLGSGIPAFNDDPDTTHADVLDVLDRTIRRNS